MVTATDRRELRAEEAALLLERSTKSLALYERRGWVKATRCPITRAVRYDRDSVLALRERLQPAR